MGLKYPDKSNLPKVECLIPKDTLYCYEYIDGRIRYCPYLDYDKDADRQCNGYCHFLGIGDFSENGTLLLWDSCKECGIGFPEG